MQSRPRRSDNETALPRNQRLELQKPRFQDVIWRQHIGKLTNIVRGANGHAFRLQNSTQQFLHALLLKVSRLPRQPCEQHACRSKLLLGEGEK